MNVKALSLSSSLHICIKYYIEKSFCEGEKVSHKRKEFIVGDIFKVAKQCLIKEQNMSLDTVLKNEHLIPFYNWNVL